jgi:hypothetical protein
MADQFALSDLGVTDFAGGQRDASGLSTGDLRRKYNFGSRVSELAIAQDPFFRFVSKVGKKSTDDPQFKFSERRPSFHKRYGYILTGGAAGAADTAISTAAPASGVIHLKVGTDYGKAGNLGNVYGSTVSSTYGTLGVAGTEPQFFMPGQLIKIPLSSANASAASANAVLADYQVARITAVNDIATGYKKLTCSIVRGHSGTRYYMGVEDSVKNGSTASAVSQEQLEPFRVYVVGTAHEQGSGYPDTWKDQPFSTSYGNTQIWKTSMAMDNTTRATVLKYEPNEWARVWREKLIEHKWDIEQSLLFNGEYDTAGGAWTTQGAVDYISSFGNAFGLTIASKTQDDFLNDMSAFLDPRYNSANASLFFCDTATYNWLHKLSGYFANNLEISPNFRADMSLTAKKKVFGVDISVISTPYGDMNVARNIHLDGHPAKIVAVNMKYCKYRPLVGNGLNRDTAVYVGVQTLENSGVDRRVDLIQTEAGMEWSMPEAHAIWS